MASSHPQPQCGWSSYRQIGFLGILALVALRLTVGWHFFKEGATKVEEGNFSSVGFLGSAKGPLADRYLAMLPDHDGRIRLDASQMQAALSDYCARAKAAYRFDDRASQTLSEYLYGASERLKSIYAQYANEITEYKNGFDRMATMKADGKRAGVESLRKQKEEIETKWKSSIKPVLNEIDQMTAALERNVLKLATAEQRQAVGDIAFPPLGNAPISVSTVDKVIPYFDLSIGILLILGLLTPVAAIAAGLFLGSVVLSQFPGTPGAQPTYFQAVEMVACFALAFTDAGRYAGLDFLPWSYWRSRSKAKS